MTSLPRRLRKWMSSPTLLAAALMLATLGSCGKERAPRSFVQPNAIKKADLEGTWYYLQTVLDAPPTNAAAFVGLSSDLMKIRFDVQQNVLYARRAYEQIDNSEDAKLAADAQAAGAGTPGKPYLGQPLAAWRIERQFDVIRDYNATTGEETNRIIESEERPWNQREFIRVDWSQNLVTDYSGLGLSFWFSDAKVEPVSYWDSNPASPDALHFERNDVATNPEFAAGEMNYFDLVNKYVLTPTEFTLCFAGSVCWKLPACFLRQQLDDCAAAVVKTRHAFAKVSPKHQYEPRKWDGKQMELFGIWDVNLNRLSYNRQYGITNSGVNRKAARFNLWKQSYKPDGALIPHAERELRTIPYYAGSSTGAFPADLFESGREVVRQWNEAVKGAVKAVTKAAAPPTKDVFVWCHNPVKMDADPAGPADPPECIGDLKPQLGADGKPVLGPTGKPIYVARQGDPRRSTLFWVNQFQAAGPLGYGPPMYDVETGETISGQAYIYGAGIDTWAARARDLVMLVSGRMPTDQYIEGVNVADWVSKNRAGAKDAQLLESPDVDALARSMDFDFAKGLAPEAPINLSSPKAFTQSMQRRMAAITKTGVLGRGGGDVTSTLRARVRGTPLEQMMLTPELLTANAGGPSVTPRSLSDVDMLRVSPLRLEIVERAIRERKERLGAVGVDFADFADEGIAQRALKLAADPATATLDPEAVRKAIRKDIFLAVSLHEMGHNVGLRHNFRASYDALNYHPQYWELREKGLQSTQRFGGVDASGAPIGVPYRGADCDDPKNRGRLRPRYIDCPGGAISVEEAAGGTNRGSVSEYQYSSVMDYGAEFNTDIHGLGLYDKAAMKFSYAGNGYVEVFTKVSPVAADAQKLISVQYFSGSYGYPSPLNLYGQSLKAIHYTQYPQMFEGGWKGMYERVDVPYSDIKTLSDDEPVLVDSQMRPMVPYYFCGDEFAGNLTCQRWDSGADAYEQAQDLINRYNNHYIINNFKRDRYTFYTSAEYRGRVLGRYLYPLRAQMLWYSLFRTIFTDFVGKAQANSLFTDETGWGSFTVGVTNGFDLLGRIVAQPEPGTYSLVRASESDSPFDYWRQVSESTAARPDEPNLYTVGLIDGKFGSTTWEFDRCGYYWADECQNRIGYLFDKTMALEVLTDSNAYFTGRDTSVDLRLYAIGYITPFRKQIMEKLGALFAGDFQSLAPTFTRDRTVMQPGWTLNDPSMLKPGIIDPNAGFTLQLFAGVYALSGFPAAFDQSFVEATKIFVVGNGEASIPDSQLMPTPGVAGPDATFDPAELVSATPPAGGAPGTKHWLLWTDKVTGKIYAARAQARTVHEGGTKPYRIDIGARMVEMAQMLEKAADQACAADKAGSPSCIQKERARDNYRQNLDIMRSLHNIFGYARWDADPPFYY